MIDEELINVALSMWRETNVARLQNLCLGGCEHHHVFCVINQCDSVVSIFCICVLDLLSWETKTGLVGENSSEVYI